MPENEEKHCNSLVNFINCPIHCHINTWVSKSSMIDAIATTPAMISPKAKENTVRYAESLIKSKLLKLFSSIILPAEKLHHIKSCQLLEPNDQQIIFIITATYINL